MSVSRSAGRGWLSPCPACERHIRGAERACPFCGTKTRSLSAPAAIALSLGTALSACGARALEGGEENGPSTTTGDESASISGTSATDTSGVESSTTTDEDEGDTTCAFYPCADGGGVNMCDIWNPNDCPEGEKCTAYATMGSSWDANKCVPIMGDAQVGEDCTAFGPAGSGEDDCAKGLTCWSVDPDTATGYCVEFCQGTPNLPECGVGTLCGIYNNGVLPLCLPACDPLLAGADCPVASEVCVPSPGQEGFVCVPGAGDLGWGSDCSYANACADGLVCVEAGFFGLGCNGIGCCTDYCDVTDMAGDMQCQGYPTHACVPYFEPGMAPPGYEHVGLCGIPP